METKIKLKKKLREEGQTRNQKWGILKYLSAEIFTETSEIDQVKLRMNVGSNDMCLWYLRSKIGVWQTTIKHHQTLKSNNINTVTVTCHYTQSRSTKFHLKSQTVPNARLTCTNSRKPNTQVPHTQPAPNTPQFETQILTSSQSASTVTP